MHVTCAAACFRCGRVFVFDPYLAPTVPMRRTAGGRWAFTPVEHGGSPAPACRACVEEANLLRRRDGLPEIEIPPGAYGPEDDDGPGPASYDN